MNNWYIVILIFFVLMVVSCSEHLMLGDSVIPPRNSDFREGYRGKFQVVQHTYYYEHPSGGERDTHEAVRHYILSVDYEVSDSVMLWYLSRTLPAIKVRLGDDAERIWGLDEPHQVVSEGGDDVATPNADDHLFTRIFPESWLSSGGFWGQDSIHFSITRPGTNSSTRVEIIGSKQE